MTDKDTAQKNHLTISVVIPAYNEEKYLPLTLQSIKSQSLTPYEVIVADNNSTDKTAEIAKEYGARVVHVKEQGNVYAMKGGLDAARGDIIAGVDADTVVSSNWIEVINQAFTNGQVVGATGSIHIADKTTFTSLNNFFYYIFLQINFWLGLPHLVGFNFAVRKETYHKIGGVNTDYEMSSDVELGLRLKEYGKVVLVRQMVVAPSMRRWEKNGIRTFIQYMRGYVYTALLRKPVPLKQEIVR
jgi:glycosyltransferase involved in cell wall biosynthesis